MEILIIIFGVTLLIILFVFRRKLKESELTIAKINREIELNNNERRLEKEQFEYQILRLETEKGYLEQQIKEIEAEKKLLEQQIEKIKTENTQFIENQTREFERFIESNLTSIPYIAGMYADFLTLHYDRIANFLQTKKHPALNEAKRIKELKNETKEWIRKAKEVIYQLDYLKTEFPIIENFLETDYSEFDKIDLKDYDPVRNYITNDEWKNLSETERNQRALEKYINGKKTKWQIGRDYELYIGYLYWKKGYSVDYFGNYMGLEDLGRDLIVKKNNTIKIIQCKHWSREREIHEKHIFQLFGTVYSYCFENNLKPEDVEGIFVTTANYSSKAIEIANYLGIKLKNVGFKNDFPRIKCNINYDGFGLETKIYHLPMDQQYDRVKISKPGEFFATTVYEAEEMGFRRAYRWYGES